MAAAGPAVDPTRGTKSSKAIRVDITLNTRVNARSKRKESFTQPQVLSGVAPGCALCNTVGYSVDGSRFVYNQPRASVAECSVGFVAETLALKLQTVDAKDGGVLSGVRG